MATLALVQKAVLDLKDRTGSSLIAINRWIETNEKVSERTRVVGALFGPHGSILVRDQKTELEKPHTFCGSLRNGKVDFSITKSNWNMILLPSERQLPWIHGVKVVEDGLRSY